MSERIQPMSTSPEARSALLELHKTVEKTAVRAGLDKKLIELVKIRGSQLNGCAFCLDMHTRDARKLGESEQRLDVLSAWRETALYTEQERAALALTEAMSTLSQTRDVPDEVYRQATAVFTAEQYATVAWAAAVINTFNLLNVLGRSPLPGNAE